MYRKYLKRLLDVFLSLIGITVLSPLMIVAAVLVKVTSKGPLFFKQKRLGFKGEVFEIYKFRTMFNRERRVDREILKGDPEVTQIGYYLRRFKIDELPQIINVLKGEMSVVGPRPCMPEDASNFNDDGKERVKVRPGLTGLAQINGNIYLSWQDRWKYDRVYVESLSFSLDLLIIFKTIRIILFGEQKFIKDPND